MNILFLTLANVKTLNTQGIYEDLLREFARNGHAIYVVSPVERRLGEETHLIREENCSILRVKTGNVQKTNILEKGLSTVMLESQFIKAIREHLAQVKFDLVLYSTPPITLAGAVEYVKKRDGAKTYLLLKDIFPQNAVDLGMMQETGIKSVIYRNFRKKEKQLYELSDYIGCMSPANVEFLLKHNPEVAADRVEVCPNCIEAVDMSVATEEKTVMREKYGIPVDRKVFVYGGNLGRPQGIPFLIDCLRSQKDNEEVFFLIVGSGTEYGKLEQFIQTEQPKNVKLMSSLPRAEYDRLVGSCDVGMIFLDHRFTIPNFPSRLLSYMQAKIPVLAVTDPNTDIGKIAVEGDFGWWCESNSTKMFSEAVHRATQMDPSQMEQMGQRGWAYLNANYDTHTAYETVLRRICGQGDEK